jgi:hypothetical protein
MPTGTIPLTGKIRDAAGNLFNGAIRLVLSYSASHHITLDDLVIAEEVNFPIQNGVLPATARLVPNDMLTPANTTYIAQYLNPGGKIVGQNVFYVSGNAFDIGTAIPTPLTTSNISFAVEELQGPPGPPGPPATSFPLTPGTAVYADTMYLIKAPGSASSDSRAMSMRVVDDQIRHASRFPGTNAGEKIVAAIADLPSTGGIVDCRGFEGSQAITQNIFAGLGDRPMEFIFGAAQFHVTVTQTISFQTNLLIRGVNPAGTLAAYTPRSTQFVWDGANGGTVFLIDCARDNLFENFGILPGSGTIAIGIRIDHASTPTGYFISVNNHFKQISIFTSTCAFQVGNASTQNNSEMIFEDCHIFGTGTYGIYINHGQSKRIKIVRGNISDRTYGVYCNAGSFVADDMTLSANDSDFAVVSAADAIEIRSCESENSGRFFTNTGGSLSPIPLVLIANSYVPNLSDGTLVSLLNPGPLTMIGNDFSGGTYVAASITAQGTIAGAARVVSIGNIYPNDQVFVNNPNAGNADIVSLNDNAYIAGNNVVQMPNLLGTAYNGVLTLSNGANNNIPASGGSFAFITSRQYRIIGPTGAFSITGFTGGVAGREIQVFNTTAQQMTITNLATSSAGNQIQTLTGGNVVLRTGTSYASFVYDIVLAKWILTSTN